MYNREKERGDKMKFDPLWVNEDYGVLCTLKELQEFVQDKANKFGVPCIAVHGTVRKIGWKSLGAGLYLVTTQMCISKDTK